MRKIVAIILIITLTFASPVLADNASLIGRKISKEVKVIMLGQELEKKAILIDGVTYVPLRVVTEQLGLQAEFVNGKVVVRNKSDELNLIELKIKNKKEEISEANNKIKLTQEALVSQKALIEDLKIKQAAETDEAKKREIQWSIDFQQGGSPTLEERIPIYQQQLTQLESELAELEKQKVELEATQ